MKIKLKKGEVLCLRTCDKDLKGHGGFQWPKSGVVKCTDWLPKKSCGNGLHGLKWGVGDGSVLNWNEDAVWMLVAVMDKSIIDMGNKVKFPSCRVVFCGQRHDAVKFITEYAPGGSAIVSGTATAGDRGTATAGDSGTATAGDSGTATAGYSGTATAGDRGTATAGDRGTATAGDSGTISIEYFDEINRRYRRAIGEIGIDGLKPNVPYVVINGKLTEKSKA